MLTNRQFTNTAYHAEEGKGRADAMDSITSTIVDGMAKALYVEAYASEVEANEIAGDSPGQGEDWFDYAPSTPDYARERALMLAGKVENENGMSLVCLIYQAAKADGISTDGADDKRYPDGEIERYWYERMEGKRLNYAESFGHYLAMQCLGHGVSWFDDHEDFPLKTVHAESLDLEDVIAIEQ